MKNKKRKRKILRVNNLLMPNKTELEYYHYQAKKGAKV